ncbi:thioesterase family protein [Bacillus sp. dmp10]|uniref:acyl-CoA thioesterase n=1 Tax=Bacillus sp. dmp10 TaxID=2293321 RepID=UPI000E2F82AF|nr:acyl-CoA thioesterase [Bacillus sp. dmp10]
MFKHDIIVRSNEYDFLRPVNNANHLIYFEEARNQLYQIFNSSLKIKSSNLIIASIQCDFIHELINTEKVTIYTWISQVEHAIQDEHQNWIERGKVILAHFNFQLKKSIPLPKEIQHLLSDHNEAPNGIPKLRSKHTHHFILI